MACGLGRHSVRSRQNKDRLPGNGITEFFSGFSLG